MELSINALIMWNNNGESRVERVLRLDATASRISVINTNEEQKRVMPSWRRWDDLEEEFRVGHARCIDESTANSSNGWHTDKPEGKPTNRLSVPESEIPPRHRKIRDAAWEVIAPLVEREDLSMFSPGTRGRLINSRSIETGTSRKEILGT